MPQYEFECKKCHHQYTELADYDPDGKYPKVKCPKCKSKRKERLMSMFGFGFTADAAPGTKWHNASHTRRYYMKLEKDRKLREEAERKSHMGSNPYPVIDDISSGKHFGEVK